MGNTSKKYSAEVRDRAVRLFQEHAHEHPSRWAAMQSIAGKIGCTTQTLSEWVENFRAYGAEKSGGHCVGKAAPLPAARWSG